MAAAATTEKKTWLTYNLMPSPPLPLSAFAFFGMRASSFSATSQTYLDGEGGGRGGRREEGAKVSTARQVTCSGLGSTESGLPLKSRGIHVAYCIARERIKTK